MNKNVNAAPNDAIQAIQIVEEMSNLLETGLDKETMAICIRLIETGINPTTLAHVILELKKEASKFSNNE